ncbi:MAG: MucR family transcriptional regulator [Syntrophobacteraceae bacterium]
MERKLTEIASEIVKAQATVAPMSPDDIALYLERIFRTLQEIQGSEAAGTDPETNQGVDRRAMQPEEKPALTPETSIQNDKVICLECGSEFRQLTQKHLASHGMSTIEYKKKFGFSMKTPLSARSLTRARSKAAKKRGLPENLTKFIEARRASKAETKPAPETKPAVQTKAPRHTRATKIKNRFTPKIME